MQATRRWKESCRVPGNPMTQRMHPMFVKLFLEEDADELTEAGDKRRKASRARRARARTTARVTARGRNHSPQA